MAVQRLYFSYCYVCFILSFLWLLLLLSSGVIHRWWLFNWFLSRRMAVLSRPNCLYNCQGKNNSFNQQRFLVLTDLNWSSWFSDHLADQSAGPPARWPAWSVRSSVSVSPVLMYSEVCFRMIVVVASTLYCCDWEHFKPAIFIPYLNLCLLWRYTADGRDKLNQILVVIFLFIFFLRMKNVV